MLNQLINSAGFWSLLGILIGSCIGFIFSTIQKQTENKRDFYKMQVAKMEEISDSLNLLNEKISRIRNMHQTKDTYLTFWARNPDFWTDINFIRLRMQVCTFFPNSLKEYDDLQVVISNFMKYVNNVQQSGDFSLASIIELNKQIINKRNLFVNSVVEKYLKR
jgi:hypothetical protein